MDANSYNVFANYENSSQSAMDVDEKAVLTNQTFPALEMFPSGVNFGSQPGSIGGNALNSICAAAPRPCSCATAQHILDLQLRIATLEGEVLDLQRSRSSFRNCKRADSPFVISFAGLSITKQTAA
jgi:hypothetical protein